MDFKQNSYIFTFLFSTLLPLLTSCGGGSDEDRNTPSDTSTLYSLFPQGYFEGSWTNIYDLEGKVFSDYAAGSRFDETLVARSTFYDSYSPSKPTYLGQPVNTRFTTSIIDIKDSNSEWSNFSHVDNYQFYFDVDRALQPNGSLYPSIGGSPRLTTIVNYTNVIPKSASIGED